MKLESPLLRLWTTFSVLVSWETRPLISFKFASFLLASLIMFLHSVKFSHKVSSCFLQNSVARYYLLTISALSLACFRFKYVTIFHLLLYSELWTGSMRTSSAMPLANPLIIISRINTHICNHAKNSLALLACILNSLDRLVRSTRFGPSILSASYGPM
jgi:hypothetical protein